MIKEPGVFSQRYLMRKGKENHNSINQYHATHNQNQNNNTHSNQLPQFNQQNHTQNPFNQHHLASQHDFPLAYTSVKTISRERNSISVGKKKVDDKKNDLKQQIEQKNDMIGKLQKQLRELKEHTKKVTREVQNRYSQYDKHINELSEELRQKEDHLGRKQTSLKEQRSKSNRFKETIKKQIYWLLNFFKKLHEGPQVEQVKREVSNAFMAFKDYISQFGIEKQLQELASATVHQIASSQSQNSSFRDQSSKKNMDSIFTQDLQEVNMIKIMELQPLIETFNNQQYFVAPEEEPNNKMERITKRLFDDSEIFRESNQCSLMVGEEERKNTVNNSRVEQNQFIPKQTQLQLPKEVKVMKSFEPDSRHENFITLREGEILKLLRKIRDKLWIGELGDKIGLVSEEYFKLC